MCILNCSALGQLNGSMTVIASPRTSQCRDAPSVQPKEDKNKPVTRHAHGSYKATFEACFVNQGCLEKHMAKSVFSKSELQQN